MDYKYIRQLLDRYFKGETSLEEEEILRAFFSQTDVPADLRRYRDLFAYEVGERAQTVLDGDFDERLLSKIKEDKPVKAHIVTMRQRLMPLFRAAAVVAIFLTLGNAAQVAFRQDAAPVRPSVELKVRPGLSVAYSDSAIVDSLQQSSLGVGEQSDVSSIIIK